MTAQAPPPPQRVRSFQNCTEAEVHAYNDCPAFLIGGAGSRRLKLGGVLTDTSRAPRTSSLAADTPRSKVVVEAPTIGAPPLSRSRKSARDDAGLASPPSPALPAHEILQRVTSLCEQPSSLPEREFEYYKSKLSKNLEHAASSPNTVLLLTEFFQLKDSQTREKLLTDWICNDVSISAWCPALLKIYKSAEQVS